MVSGFPAAGQRAIRALYVGCIFLVLGWLAIAYDFIEPGRSSQPLIEITATGQKAFVSKGDEVWFYGAFDAATGRRLTSEVDVPASTWQAKGESFVAVHGSQRPIRIAHDHRVRLELGSHAYSGIARITAGGHPRTVDLHASRTQGKTIELSPYGSFRDSPWRYAILAASFATGVAISLLLSCGRAPRSQWLPVVLAMLGTYLVFCAFFPGVYTNDSVSQLRQAISRQYSDWHPPLMAWIWAGLLAMTGRIESMFSFHLLLLLAGAMAWIQVFTRTGLGRWSVLVPVVMLSPWVTNFSGVIWKDVGFAGAMLLGSALVVLSREVAGYRPLLLGSATILAVYAIGIRPNGLLALIPLAALALAPRTATWSARTAGVHLGAALLATTAVAGCVQVITHTLIEPRRLNPAQYLQWFDLAGISARSGHDRLPADLNSPGGAGTTEVVQAYWTSINDLGNANNIVFEGPNGEAPLIPLTFDDPASAEKLRQQWLRAIAREPTAYLEHRAAVFHALMSRSAYSSERPQTPAERSAVFQANLLPPVPHDLQTWRPVGAPAAQRMLSDVRLTAQWHWLYSGWLWLGVLAVAGAVGLALRTQTRCRNALRVLAASGMLYMLPYYFIAPATDYRYLYWSVMSGALCVCLLAALVIERGLEGIRTRLHGTRDRTDRLRPEPLT